LFFSRRARLEYHPKGIIIFFDCSETNTYKMDEEGIFISQKEFVFDLFRRMRS
jgi:hypothetical protein